MDKTPETISLICDITIAAVILISAFVGKSKGFFKTVMSFLRWFICTVAPFLLVTPLRTFLIENTNMDDSMASHIQVNLNKSADGLSLLRNLTPPDQKVIEQIDNIEEGMSMKIATSLSYVIMSILAFFILIIFFRLLTGLLFHMIPESSSKTTLGKVDRFNGFLFGAMRGFIFVCLIMLILLPVFSLLGPDSASPILHGIRKSLLGNQLYFNNPFLKLLNMLWLFKGSISW